MKILHIIWASVKANGILSATTHLAEAQIAAGNEVVIVNLFRQSQPMAGIVWAPSIKIFLDLLNDFKPDIATINGIFYKEFRHACKALQKEGIPYLIAYHGSYSRANYAKSTLKKFSFKHLFLKPAVKHAANVIFLSENEFKNSIVSSLKKNPFIIPNGCIMPHENQIKSKCSDPIEIIYIGRMDIVGKGLDVLFEALSLLQTDNSTPRFHLSLYGPDKDDSPNWLKRHIAPLEGLVDRYDSVYDEDKNEVLRNADIAILVSRSEGFPVSILEALSFGVPCIVTPQTNIADIIAGHQCGWSTELDATSVADTIHKACLESLSQRSTLARNARRTAMHYSWTEIADLSLIKYNSIIQK